MSEQHLPVTHVGGAQSPDGVFVATVDVVGEQIAMTLCVRKLPFSTLETEFYGGFHFDAATCAELARALAEAAERA